MSSIEISLVLPVYNEENVLDELNGRLIKIFNDLGQSYEMIYVDDGSEDSSLEKLKTFHRVNKNIKIINLSRNFGHVPALMAGIGCASGNCVIILDSDLQDKPEAIKDFYAKWKAGYDVVYAIRVGRKESIFMRIAFKSFYRILARISNISQPIDVGVFSLMDRRVVNVLKTLKEKSRYIPGLRSYMGFKQIGLEVERGPRASGESRVGIKRLIRLAFDAFFSFSYLPLRIATFGGTIIALLSFLAMAYLVIQRILFYFEIIKMENFVPGVTLIGSSLFFLTGVILICMGVIGEYIGRIYDEVKDRPYYIIKDKTGFGMDNKEV